MNIVDSCRWLEFFADGPNADFYAAAIADTEHLFVPTVTLFEVFKRVLQQREGLENVRYIPKVSAV